VFKGKVGEAPRTKMYEAKKSLKSWEKNITGPNRKILEYLQQTFLIGAAL